MAVAIIHFISGLTHALLVATFMIALKTSITAQNRKFLFFSGNLPNCLPGPPLNQSSQTLADASGITPTLTQLCSTHLRN